MPEEHGIDRLDPNFSKMLDIRNRPKVPGSVLDAAIATIPLFGTSPWGNVLFDSVVGAVGVTNVELTKTPDGKIRVPIAVELSHNDATARNLRLFLKWDRAGVTTSVCLKASFDPNPQSEPQCIEDFSRLYLGPTARILGNTLALAAGSIQTLKMAYFELTLGETAPP